MNACPVECISMHENDIGEIHPNIDIDKCIECNQCVQSCPNNFKITLRTPEKVLANWIENKEKRKKCASGGIATIMSEYAIREKKGIVYGTCYDDNLNPVCTKATKIEEIEKFKGSKYVQSFVGDTYKDVKNDLVDGKFVLFIGTPCQISGLLSFLKNKAIDNLITCDLICHGVIPMQFFKEEINYLKNKKNIKNITDCRFRGNDRRNFRFSLNFRLSLWDNKKLKYVKYAYSQYYFHSFMKGVSLRESCYHCKYAQPKRVADITIGDFLGLGKKTPFKYPTRNVSLTLLNTKKGLEFWSRVETMTSSLKCIQREYEEALQGSSSLNAPTRYHKYTHKFRGLYKKDGNWVKTIRVVLKKDVRKSRLTFYFTYSVLVIKKIIPLIYKNISVYKENNQYN